jgi:hypothetical protein
MPRQHKAPTVRVSYRFPPEALAQIEEIRAVTIGPPSATAILLDGLARLHRETVGIPGKIPKKSRKTS